MRTHNTGIERSIPPDPLAEMDRVRLSKRFGPPRPDLTRGVEIDIPASRQPYPCARCGMPPIVYESDAPARFRWVVLCDNCYDGAPDSATRHEIGTGATPERAARDWNGAEYGMPPVVPRPSRMSPPSSSLGLHSDDAPREEPMRPWAWVLLLVLAALACCATAFVGLP